MLMYIYARIYTHIYSGAAIFTPTLKIYPYLPTISKCFRRRKTFRRKHICIYLFKYVYSYLMLMCIHIYIRIYTHTQWLGYFYPTLKARCIYHRECTSVSVSFLMKRRVLIQFFVSFQ